MQFAHLSRKIRRQAPGLEAARGFTLVELLLVLVILALIGSLVLPGIIGKAEGAKAKAEHFPRLALQMISVGEETGQLDTMLMKVSDTYDTEVRNTIDRLLSIFTPVVTLFLAVLIGTIVLSVLVAILSVNDLVG